MKIFRNPEIKRTAAVCLLCYALVAGLCLVVDMAVALLPLTLLFVLMCGVTLHSANKRYENLEFISRQLDKILYGTTEVDFGSLQEGELSIMKSQLDKVVLKLRQQTEDLQKEKIKLTDSIRDISHQLRTPLTSINLIINFLKREEVTSEKRWQSAAELQQLANRIDWLINALLKISKIDAGTADFHKDRVDMFALVKKRAAPLEITMDLKDQQLIIEQSGGEYFTGDMNWTAEAIGNLIKNCSEHTPAGGTITAKIEQTPVYTQLEISDTGPGFASEDMDHLFTRFYKGKNSSPESVGIGLALARMIITNQNGTIKAANDINGGAKFTVKFYHTVI